MFTSFKLPKPGMSNSQQQQYLSHHSPEFMSSLTPPPTSKIPSFMLESMVPPTFPQGPLKLSAPLGGLPAMASQLSNNDNHKEDPVELLKKSKSNDENSQGRSKTPDSNDEGEENNGESLEDSPPKNQQGMIKAAGTYYPLTAFPTNMPQGPVMRRDNSSPRPDTSSGTCLIDICILGYLCSWFFVAFRR